MIRLAKGLDHIKWEKSMQFRNSLMILVSIANISFARSVEVSKDSLSISPISHHSAMFSALEIHNMGVSGLQKIQYVVDCKNQTMSLIGFDVTTPSGRVTSNETNANSYSMSFYKPTYEHDVRILHKACGEESERKAMK